jgi:hypothetical protein
MTITIPPKMNFVLAAIVFLRGRIFAVPGRDSSIRSIP